MVHDSSGGHGFPRDEKKNPLGDEKPPYSYSDYVHEDEDEYEGRIFKRSDEKKQPLGSESYPDEKKQPLGFESYPDEKSYPMGFDTYASTSHKAPAAAAPEPEADEFFYPINNSSFASRNQSVDHIALAQPPHAVGNKHSSLTSDELDRTFADDASLNNLKKYDDIYDDAPHHRRSNNGDNVGRQDMSIPQTQGYFGRNDEQGGSNEMSEKQDGDYHHNGKPETSPYVGRWAQMSRAWSSQVIVMMLFSAFSYYLLAQDANDMAQDAILQITSACLSLESATNTVINAPRSVAISTVTMVQKTAQSIIDVTGRSFLSIISILENLIGWILRMYLGTYICIAEVIIRTALKIATDVAKVLTDALEVAVNTVVGGLQSVAADIAGGIEKGINDIGKFFTGGKEKNAVDFNVEDIRKQLTISIPTDWINSISGLADKIPTQEQLFGNIEQIINIPFKLMTDAINGTFSNARVNLVNSTTFAEEKFSDMCGVPMGQDTVNELAKAIMWIMYIAAFAFLGAAVALLLFELYSINRGENKLQIRLLEFRQDLTEYSQDLIESKSRRGLAKFRDKFNEYRQDLTDSGPGLANFREKFSEYRRDLTDSGPALSKFREKFSEYRQDLTDSGPGMAKFRHGLAESRQELAKFRQGLTESRQEFTEHRSLEAKDEVDTTPATRKEMDLFMLPGRPWFQRATNIITKKYGDNEKTTAWRWYLDYIWHPPAMACFLVGAMGLISVFVQISAIDGLREVYIPKFANDMNKFQDQFLGEALLGGVRNDSIALAASINSDIASSETSLDRVLFAPIDDGTTSLNKTLNEFVGTYIGGIRSVFGGTPLEYPIEGLVNCTLTKNIQSVQKVLTFVNDFAGGLTFPRVSDNVIYDPVLALMKPVNKSAIFLREFAVGVYIPNADSLDPLSFLPDEDMKRSSYAASLSSKYNSLHPSSSSSDSDSIDSSDSSVESSAGSSLNAATDLANNPTLVPGAVLLRRDISDTSIPNVLSANSLPITGDANVMTALGAGLASLPLTDSLLPSQTSQLVSNSDSSSNVDPQASLTMFGTKPTSELTREEVEGAQRYDGYTGGILNKLCDAYIQRLRDRIPLMVALMASWLIIVLLGLVNLARRHRRIKRDNLH
ncbi:plasma membrane fusion protein prm1 [Coemansia sp. RSA 2424]|nr:plasma membrane fusion protein prm1 [Coemansia sp. RSA 2424]